MKEILRWAIVIFVEAIILLPLNFMLIKILHMNPIFQYIFSFCVGYLAGMLAIKIVRKTF